MTYEAIARKWRPMSFQEISGQGHVTRTLLNALKRDRVHHAYLFTGPRGVGKTTAARTLARSLNCEEGGKAEPCQQCVSCREIATGNSPDVMEIDGASNNSVDDVRELRDKVQYLPARGTRRIFIVDEVHMLSKGAFNALLKTLEEPPPHVIFIFATTEPQKIPETILSRVQRFDFKRISESTVAARLRKICDAESVELSDAALRMIARAGEGSMRDSQSLLDQVLAFGGTGVSDEEVGQILGLVDRSLLYETLEGLLQGTPERSLKAIATAYEYGFELAQFSEELLGLLRNAAFVGLSPGAREFIDIPEEETAKLISICEGIGPDVFSRYFDVMLETHDSVVRSAAPRMVLEMAVARMASARAVQPVDVLLSRLEQLERRLRGGGHAPSIPRHGAAPRRSAGREVSEERGDPEPAPRGGGGGGAALKLQPAAEVRLVEVPTPAFEEPSRPSVTPDAPVMSDSDGARPSLRLIPREEAPAPEQPASTSREEFDALLRWARHQGGVYRTLSQSCAFGGLSGGVLTLLFPTSGILKRGEELLKEASLREAAREIIPGFQRFIAKVRPEGSTALTAREIAKIEAEKHLETLRGEVAADPIYTLLADKVGATVERIVPIDPVDGKGEE